MKCPYNINIQQVNQNKHEYNSDGQNSFHEHKLIEKRDFTDCLESECAAWQDGRCNYRGE